MNDQRWNLNVHYQRVVLDAVPIAAATALDVGAGDGLLSFALADRGLDVTAIDPDAASVDRASEDARHSDRVEFIVGDVFTYPLRPGSFDIVGSIAMLHHVDAVQGLRRMVELVRPGGAVALVGFAAPSSRADVARGVIGGLYKRSKQLRGQYWEHGNPTCWPPPCSTAEMRILVEQVLPGARFRPLLSGRYAVTWIRPS